MQLENLAYAMTQVIHNFGAVAVVGGALTSLRAKSDQLALKLTMAWVVFVAWSAQAISGLVFGGVSLYFYGETPDLHAAAQVSLGIKMVCATSGILLSLIYIRGAKNFSEKGIRRMWHSLTGLGVTALTAAAFLRWFS